MSVQNEDGSAPLTGIIAIEGGGGHTLAVAANGALWAWGYNHTGQLGDGTSGPDRVLPVPVLSASGTTPLPDVVQVAAGGSHSLALVKPVQARLTAPPVTRGRDIAISLEAKTAFSANGYYLSEVMGLPANPAAWSPAPPSFFTLSPNDGAKTVYGYVRDDHGYLSAAAVASVVLDTASPTATLHVKPYTRSKRVALTLTGLDSQGIVAYYLSTDFAVPPVDVAGWKSTSPKSFPLAGADGTKTVYAWTRDAAGNVSATASGTTVQDRKAPVIAIAAPKRDAKLAKLTRIAGTTVDPLPGAGIKSARFAIRHKQGTTCTWWKPRLGKLVAAPCTAPAWLALSRQQNWARSIGMLDDAGAKDWPINYRRGILVG